MFRGRHVSKANIYTKKPFCPYIYREYKLVAGDRRYIMFVQL